MEPSSIAQLFGLTEVPGNKGCQVVRQEVYDADLYGDVISDSAVLQDTVARGSELLATFDHLLQDIFVSLFKLEPELLPIEEVAEKVEFNRSMMEAFYTSEEFERLRTMTQLDPLASALGTQVLGEKALQQLFHQDDTPEDTGNGLADIAANACQETVDEVMDLLGQARSWGLEPGDLNLRVGFQSKRRALERLRSSPSLQQLSQLIGRFKLLAREVFRKKGSDGSTTISSVTTGGNLEQVLPSEKMMLGNSTTKLDFLRRYHQKELLQYKSKNQPSGKGPMVVCCDVSGSMSGKPEEWSKAVLLALAEVAQKQKRDFACILFNGDVVGTWIIPKGTWDPVAIIDIAEVAPNGGTNFMLPLSCALDIISESKFRRADVVFITDGDCGVDESFTNTFNKAKEHKGFMVFTVLISKSSKAAAVVEKFSDEVITISSLAQLDDGSAAAIFSKVQSRGF